MTSQAVGMKGATRLRSLALGFMGALLFGLLAGCGPAAVVPKLPSQGGPKWIELQTDHFTLWTDVSPEKARAVMQQLETRRQVLARGMNRARQGERIFAVVFRSYEELLPYLPPNVGAYAWPDANPTDQPGLVMAVESPDLIINHELAHAISFALIVRQPRWLSEALASYFEMGEVDPKTHEVTIGIPHASRLARLREGSPIYTRQLFACKKMDCASEKFYAWSWALFSFLLDQHFDRFALYLQSLQANEGDHDKAWAQAFGALSLDDLDQALLEWSRSGDLKVVRFKIDPQPIPAVERPLGDADVLALRGMFALFWGDYPRADRDVKAALAVDRSNLMAMTMAMALEHDISEERLRELMAARPDHWRPVQLLAIKLFRMKTPMADIEPLRLRMCELAAKDRFYCKGYGPQTEISRPVRPTSAPASAPVPKPPQ